jgi:NADH-quinone oxidoreductase subunit E
MGAPELKKFIKETLGIEPGQTSADGKFHFSEVECQGACGGAPMIALNHTYHENLTVEKLDNIIKGCK